MILAVFRSKGWAAAVEAWYEALGVSVIVSDAASGRVIAHGPRAGYCDVSLGREGRETILECLEDASAGFCRGGTPCTSLSLRIEERLEVRLLIGGYVTSAAQRSELGERLLKRGLGEIEVKALLRGIPVIPKRRIGAVAAMVLNQARVLIDAAAAEERTRVRGERRERELCELMQISEVARMLNRGVRSGEVAPLVASLLEKALDFRVGGVVLAGYGMDRAVVVIRGDVSAEELEWLAGEAAGRTENDVPPIEILSHLGEVVETAEAREWVVLSEPLAAENAVFGYLFAARAAPERFDGEDERLIRRLASHVAVAVHRTSLFDRLLRDYTRTIELLSAALDAGEGMAPGHAGQVTEYAMRIGEEMRLAADDLELLRFAGLVHDIGKLGVPGELLLRPARLTEEEMAVVRLHSQYGATLVEQMDFLGAVAPIVLHHHERWDGSGYPVGLAAEATPLLARILGVADAYVSMCAATPYRPALGAARAEAELASEAGTRFDPRVVQALRDVLRRMETAGSSGLLAGRETGETLPA